MKFIRRKTVANKPYVSPLQIRDQIANSTNWEQRSKETRDMVPMEFDATPESRQNHRRWQP